MAVLSMYSLSHFVYLFCFKGELEVLFTKALADELTDDDQILLQEVIDIVYRAEHVTARSLEFSSSTRSVIIETSFRYKLLMFEPNVLYIYLLEQDVTCSSSRVVISCTL